MPRRNGNVDPKDVAYNERVRNIRTNYYGKQMHPVEGQILRSSQNTNEYYKLMQAPIKDLHHFIIKEAIERL